MAKNLESDKQSEFVLDDRSNLVPKGLVQPELSSQPDLDSE